MSIGPVIDERLVGRAARFAEGWWSRVTDTPDLIVPDGGVDLMWSPGRRPWLAGPDTGPVRSTLPAASLVVGVRLRPGVAAPLIRQSMTYLADQRVELDDSPEIDPAIPAHEAGRHLVRLIDRGVGDEWQADDVVLDAMDRIRRRLPLPDYGLGHRQFRRRFCDVVGYGPKLYDRVCRLDRLASIAARHPERSLAQLAAGAGYHDQPHLNRDCRALAGCTPSVLLGRG